MAFEVGGLVQDEPYVEDLYYVSCLENGDYARMLLGLDQEEYHTHSMDVVLHQDETRLMGIVGKNLDTLYGHLWHISNPDSPAVKELSFRVDESPEALHDRMLLTSEVLNGIDMAALEQPDHSGTALTYRQAEFGYEVLIPARWYDNVWAGKILMQTGTENLPRDCLLHRLRFSLVTESGSIELLDLALVDLASYADGPGSGLDKMGRVLQQNEDYAILDMTDEEKLHVELGKYLQFSKYELGERIQLDEEI